MAKLVYSSIIESASGRLAGSTLSRKVVRNQAGQRRPTSVRQANKRKVFKDLFYRWRSFSSAVKKSWEIAGMDRSRTGLFNGGQFTPGQNYFRNLNMVQAVNTSVIITTPPAKLPFVRFRILRVTQSVVLGSLVIQLRPFQLTTAYQIIVYASRPLPSGNLSSHNRFRFIRRFDATGNINVSIGTEYITAWHRLPTSVELVHFRIQVLTQNSGALVSERFVYSVLV